MWGTSQIHVLLCACHRCAPRPTLTEGVLFREAATLHSMASLHGGPLLRPFLILISSYVHSRHAPTRCLGHLGLISCGCEPFSWQTFFYFIIFTLFCASLRIWTLLVFNFRKQNHLQTHAPPSAIPTIINVCWRNSNNNNNVTPLNAIARRIEY